MSSNYSRFMVWKRREEAFQMEQHDPQAAFRMRLEADELLLAIHQHELETKRAQAEFDLRMRMGGFLEGHG